jgi:predicted secreted hydrolase
VTRDGRTLPLREHDFEIAATGPTWESPATGAVYPAEWRIVVPGHGIDAVVAPLLAAQEMDTRATTRIVYWEGAVEVRGSRPGLGYVELTNYDRVPSPSGR